LAGPAAEALEVTAEAVALLETAVSVVLEVTEVRLVSAVSVVEALVVTEVPVARCRSAKVMRTAMTATNAHFMTSA
jgi:hypothetical protein